MSSAFVFYLLFCTHELSIQWTYPAKCKVHPSGKQSFHRFQVFFIPLIIPTKTSCAATAGSFLPFSHLLLTLFSSTHNSPRTHSFFCPLADMRSLQKKRKRCLIETIKEKGKHSFLCFSQLVLLLAVFQAGLCLFVVVLGERICVSIKIASISHHWWAIASSHYP